MVIVMSMVTTMIMMMLVAVEPLAFLATVANMFVSMIMIHPTGCLCLFDNRPQLRRARNSQTSSATGSAPCACITRSRDSEEFQLRARNSCLLGGGGTPGCQTAAKRGRSRVCKQRKRANVFSASENLKPFRAMPRPGS